MAADNVIWGTDFRAGKAPAPICNAPDVEVPMYGGIDRSPSTCWYNEYLSDPREIDSFGPAVFSRPASPDDCA